MKSAKPIPADRAVAWLAGREGFKARAAAFLVELTVAARGLGVEDPAAVARRALQILVDEASSA